VQAPDLMAKTKILQQCLQNHLVAISFKLLPNNDKTIKIGKAVSLGFGKQQPLGLYQSDIQKINELVQNAQNE